MTERVYFVTGIDTDAGKSYATGVLAASWREQGIDVITQKFVQTGCGEDCEAVSEDIALHRKIMGCGLLPEDIDGTTCPLRFCYPASADLAARLDGRRVDPAVIDAATSSLLERHQVVLIEGAGGLMVPLDGQYTTLDYIRERDLPVILVTNPKLGSVNHTLLSLMACACNNVRVAMLVYNHWPVTSDIITDDTRLFLRGYMSDHFPDAEFVEMPFIESL